MQVGAVQVGVLQVRAGQIRVVHGCVTQVSAGQGRAGQLCIGESQKGPRPIQAILPRVLRPRSVGQDDDGGLHVGRGGRNDCGPPGGRLGVGADEGAQHLDDGGLVGRRVAHELLQPVDPAEADRELVVVLLAELVDGGDEPLGHLLLSLQPSLLTVGGVGVDQPSRHQDHRQHAAECDDRVPPVLIDLHRDRLLVAATKPPVRTADSRAGTHAPGWRGSGAGYLGARAPSASIQFVSHGAIDYGAGGGTTGRTP